MGRCLCSLVEQTLVGEHLIVRVVLKHIFRLDDFRLKRTELVSGLGHAYFGHILAALSVQHLNLSVEVDMGLMTFCHFPLVVVVFFQKVFLALLVRYILKPTGCTFRYADQFLIGSIMMTIGFRFFGYHLLRK